MKAKDYFNKYGERLADPEKCDAALGELVNDFLDETKQILEKRKNTYGNLSHKACMAIINEMNDKWNALAGMIPNMLMRNGWRNYFMKQLSRAKGEQE